MRIEKLSKPIWTFIIFNSFTATYIKLREGSSYHKNIESAHSSQKIHSQFGSSRISAYQWEQSISIISHITTEERKVGELGRDFSSGDTKGERH
jgi:hypothetical protein